MRSTRHARFVVVAGVAVSLGLANLLSSVRADTPPPVVDIWTWGLGSAGQLGPARLNATIPAPMHVPRRWIAVAAGSAHTIALTDTGEVWAWGANEHGQLGDGSHTLSMLPVQVSGLTGVTAIAAGAFHNLAYRASDETLWGWGWNVSGQLAQDPSLVDSPTPLPIGGLGALKGIAGGGSHSVVLAEDGTVFAWGANLVGQLGTGDFAPHTSPVPVLLPGPAVAVGAGGGHSLAALASGGVVYTWGWNVFGQLGRGYQGTPDAGEPLPAPAFGVKDAVQLTGGDLHCLARTSDGHVWAWGYNTEGQIGSGAVTAANTGVLTPVLLDIDSVLEVRAGGVESIALKTNGEVWTWGSNQFGASGINGRADQLRPVRALEVAIAVAVAAGNKHSVALAAPRPTSAVAVFGASTASGTLPSEHPATRAVASLTDVVVLSAGAHHVLALDGNHRVWAWGDNSKGQLGVTGPSTDDPVPVPLPLDAAAGFVAVAARGDHGLALRSDGTVWAWGDNASGELGAGTTDSPLTPARVGTLENVVGVATGERHGLAQDTDGNVWGWGENGNGQLGIPASTVVTSPAVLPSVVAPEWIAAGGFHSVALTGVGKLLAWGAGSRGQLGRANLGDSAEPVSVALPRGATTAAAGRYHTLVVLDGGAVWGFGDNSACQLGASPLVYPFTYAPIDLGISNALAVEGAPYHSLAITSDHGLLGWGDDAGGQLGRSDVVRAHYDCDAANNGSSRVYAVAGGLASTTIAFAGTPSGVDAGAGD